MNETFDCIRVFTLTAPSQPINAILQISNFSGEAQFTQDMACTNLFGDELASDTGTIINLTGTTINTNTLSTKGRLTISDISGSLIGKYMNLSSNVNKGLYLYESRGSLQLQRTEDLIPSGDPALAQTTDTVTTITGWISILAPSISISNTTADLSTLITTVNALIKTFANRGIVITTEIPQIPVITDITVDVSGFYVIWTPSSASTIAIDSILYTDQAISPYFIPIATTNTFYYSLTVGSSLPFLAAFCNINTNPLDLSNYYPTFGLTPSSRAYYRATIMGQVNYILLSTETNILSRNTALFMKGSNASATTPIRFMYYSSTIFGSAYLLTSITLTDPNPHVLVYNYAQDVWTLYS
jgi:hypothetical protein